MKFNSQFAEHIFKTHYAHTKPDGTLESWADAAKRIVDNVFLPTPSRKSLIQETERYIREKKIMPGGRYIYAAGRPKHQINNCLALSVEDSREGWADLSWKAQLSLMTGAGIGVNYSFVRAEGEPIRGMGGYSSGPTSLMQILNEVGRHVMQGSSRRSAILAILSWKHQDIHKFIQIKNWSDFIKEAKARDINFPAPLDGTNISVQLDDDFFVAFHDKNHVLHSHASLVYWAVIEHMVQTGEPGFIVNTGVNSDEILSNACSEVRSADDSDICNLGSINLARIESLDEMKTAVDLATALLLAGTVYSDVPYEKVEHVRNKNRRLGLGLMGIHEWLLMRGKKYDIDGELEKYLEVYATSTKVAVAHADTWNLSRPVKTRAIAPNGTISIVAETTGGIEPIPSIAYKRRYRKGPSLTEYQYVINPTAKRVIESGINPDEVEDAYKLAGDVERRTAFQAWIQQYTDQAISSTIILPQWGTEYNNRDTIMSFGNTLIKYLPKLRGITAYPDGARGAQPIIPVKYSTASKHVGQIFVESTDMCDITKGGSCGS